MKNSFHDYSNRIFFFLVEWIPAVNLVHDDYGLQHLLGPQEVVNVLWPRHLPQWAVLCAGILGKYKCCVSRHRIRIRMDIRCEYDDLAEVCGPQSANAQRRIRPDGDRPRDTCPLLCQKNTLTPSLQMPTWRLCSPRLHKEPPGH